MTLQLIKSTHTTTHNTLQASKAVEDTYDYHYATDSFMDHLLYSIMAQGSVFAAMEKVKEINSINEYEVISAYDISKIKMLYKQETQNQNWENENWNRQRVNELRNQNMKMANRQREEK